LLDVFAGNEQICWMKRKIFVAVLTLSSGLMMVFAAAVDKCTEKHKSCTDQCTSFNMQCKARGNDSADCENRFKQCKSACDKKLTECQAKKNIGR
jgi:hypothetical protein